MASEPHEDSTNSLQHTTAKLSTEKMDGVAADSQQEKQPKSDTNIQDTTPRSSLANTQMAEDSKGTAAMDSLQEDASETLYLTAADLDELDDIASSRRLSSNDASDEDVQLHTRSRVNLGREVSPVSAGSLGGQSSQDPFSSPVQSAFPLAPGSQPATPSRVEPHTGDSSTPAQSTGVATPTLQVHSSSPVQQSYEPRYSPPNSSAISSSLASPVRPSFQRPRHPSPDPDPEPVHDSAASQPRQLQPHERAGFHHDITHPSMEQGCAECDRIHEWYQENVPDFSDEGGDAGGYDEEKGVTYDGISLDEVDADNCDPVTRENVLSSRELLGQHEAIKREQEAQLSSDEPEDDAEDVMNPPIGGGEGFVIPRVEGVTSFDGEELAQILGDSEHRSGIPQDDGTTSPSSPPLTPVRRASSPTGQPMPSSASPGAHVQFDTNVAIQDTPFAKTLKYFKEIKNKENTPSKARRNASLPEEIAELAKEAQQEGIEDEPELWNKYRELDLAPMDPVMDDGLAGDLIMSGTPTKTSTVTVTEKVGSPAARALVASSSSLSDKVTKGYANNKGTLYEVNIPGHYDDCFQLRFRSNACVELIASFIRERGEALDAHKGSIDYVVKKFLTSPEDFVMSEDDSETVYSEQDSQSTERGTANMQPASNGHDGVGPSSPVRGVEGPQKDFEAFSYVPENSQALILYEEDPVFAKVIGMLPQAMFWVAVQAGGYCANEALNAAGKAFDMAFEKLVGLSLDDSRTSK